MDPGRLFPLRSMRDASDYNRALAIPVRLVHVLLAPALSSITHARIGPHAWMHRVGITLSLLLIAAIVDPMLEGGHGIRGLGGDVRRELEAWQQFGGFTSVVVIVLVVSRLDVLGKSRAIPLVLAPVVSLVMCTVMKIAIGRVRPKHSDMTLFLGPFGSQPVDSSGGPRLVHSWELWQKGHSELWSFPSSHTASAAAIAIVLSCYYPRLRPVVWWLVAIVGFGRIVTGAHYATDVVGGTVVGMIAGAIAVRLAGQVKQTNRAPSL